MLISLSRFCFALQLAFIAASFVRETLAEEVKEARQIANACAIQVLDRESRWPVPLMELRTNHNARFITDNAGMIAFDLPELIGQETWFTVISDGYEVPANKFNLRGVRLTPEAGKTLIVEVDRTSIARRLGRLTGAGLFAESQKLGRETDWQETGVLGCDSVQIETHQGKLFWAWGDTTLAHFPLGVFHMTGATTPLRPLKSFEPPLRLKFNYFRDANGRPRGIAKMPGDGPTWVRGYAALPDKTGASRLVGTYVKITPPLDGYEFGLCAWNDETSQFDHVRTVWRKTKDSPKPPVMPVGHSVVVDGEDGRKWALFGEPLPTLRCPATFEAWKDPSTWETLTPQEHFVSADGEKVKTSSGSIAWSSFRKRWVTVFTQSLGIWSTSGDVCYAEADSPYGPWGPAVKVFSHKNYTFYNPRIHVDFTPEESPILLFEGTYTATFADRPEPTPRYDYNQILYRLDLNDERLRPAQKLAAKAASP